MRAKRLNKGEGVMLESGMVGPCAIDLTQDAEYGAPLTSAPA